MGLETTTTYQRSIRHSCCQDLSLKVCLGVCMIFLSVSRPFIHNLDSPPEMGLLDRSNAGTTETRPEELKPTVPHALIEIMRIGSLYLILIE